jgi:hypothetical protein
MEPASIRTKNPGAMWGRVGRKPTAFFETPQGPHGCETNAPIPKKWGSTKTIYLSDGLGQDNNIAIFDTWVQGICAQLDLWRTSPKYRNRRFADAIATWAGGNNVPSYIAYVKARVPGMTADTIMDDGFWRGPMGLGFLKAQAAHEAGNEYPAPDAAWIEAQRIVLSGTAPPAPKPAPSKTTATVATGTVVAGTVAAGAHQGWGVAQIALIAFIVVALGVAGYFIAKSINKAA